jgi:hypothetical protein
VRALLRLAFGALLGAAIVVVLWSLGWVEAPEVVVRRVAIFSTVYPAPRAGVTLTRVPCPPLEPARLFLVCTPGCETISRVILMRGLKATLLLDEARLPPESESVARQRINTVIRDQRLRLDADSAREMVACYVRLEGLSPELVLPPGGAESVEAARAEGGAALQALADRLRQSDAVNRIEVTDTGEGFEARMLYWDTSRDGAPILSLGIRIAPNGEVRGVTAAPLAPS